MLPIALDLAQIKVALIGEGEGFIKRKKKLEEAGAKFLTLFTPYNSNDLSVLKDFHVVLAVDLKAEDAQELAGFARSNNILLNIEDQNAYCDFHYSSALKRGDLTIAVNTGGKSPTLAKRMKEYLSSIFTKEWEERLEEIAVKRLYWKKLGLSNKEVEANTNELINKENWF